MKKIYNIDPKKLSEVAVISFFTLFFILAGIATATSQVNGNSGHCREFNGTTSGVSFANSNAGLGAGNTMTVTAWVKCISANASGNWANIVTVDDSGSNGDQGQFWLQHSQLNTAFEFAVENNNGNRNYIQSVTNPVNGVWYHVAGVYDGSFINIYVNGVLEARTGQTGNINNFQSTFKMVFGHWAYSGNAYRRFDGDIDEVTLWNVALTQTQIRTYMCKKLQGTETGLIGYWRMNETTGNSLYDITSNARTGIASNTTIVWSGAPIGDASTYTYGGTRLSISQPVNGDSMVVNSFSLAPSGIQMYRIDTVQNCVVAPSGFAYLVTTYYYGVFICDQNNEYYSTHYYYTGNPCITNPAYANLVYRADNSVMSWTGSSATLNITSNVLEKTGQLGRNEYSVGMTTGVLPIELVNFTGVQQSSSVELKWTTASEVNNDHFTIERTTDGVIYKNIATVKGAGNSDVALNYNATDNDPVSGIAYYRLTQTDYDGKVHTFAPVAVSYVLKEADAFDVQNIYPTVFTNTVTVNIACDNAVDVNADIISMNGSVMSAEIIHCKQGNTQYDFNPGTLSSGLYMLVLSDPISGHVVSKRIVKQL